MGNHSATSRTGWFGIMALIGLLLLVRALSWAQEAPGVRPGVPPTRPAIVIPAETPNVSHAARARIDLARKALEVIQRIHDLGQYGGKSEFDDVYLWSRRMIEAQKEIGGKKAELIAALEDHLARMKKWADVAKARHAQGEIDALALLDAQYRVMEAESWLAEAKASK